MPIESMKEKRLSTLIARGECLFHTRAARHRYQTNTPHKDPSVRKLWLTSVYRGPEPQYDVSFNIMTEPGWPSNL